MPFCVHVQNVSLFFGLPTVSSSSSCEKKATCIFLIGYVVVTTLFVLVIEKKIKNTEKNKKKRNLNTKTRS